MRRKIAYIVVALAACVPLTTGLLGGQAANAIGSEFDIVNNNFNEFSDGCAVDDHFGAGHQLVMGQDTNTGVCAGESDFFLVNENIISGVITWEISDSIGCMNRSDSTGVYINGCNPGQTTEEWIFDAEGNIENVHAGTNGFLNVDCNQIGGACPDTVVAVHPMNPWLMTSS